MSPSMPQPTSIVTSSTKPTSSRGLEQGDKGAGKGDDDDDVVVDRKVILILLSVAIGVMILGMIIITVAICCVFQRIK